MLPLPLVAPRDSHELWFGSSRPRRYSPSSSSLSHQPGGPSASESARRQSHHHYANSRTLASSTTPSDSLAALLFEERALRIRKENIASFGCAWIKPAGCPKTMLGMREEDAEREEGLAAAAQEMNAAAAAAAAAAATGAATGATGLADVDAFGDATQQGMGQMGEHGEGGEGEELERDLDDDIPEADEGLVEEGEEGYEDDEDPDGELMERNLDDDIPDGFSEGNDSDDEDEDEDDFDNQPDLDNDIPAADGEAGYGGIMVRDLDDDVPEAADEDDEDEDMDEGEWQHTDSEDEEEDDDDDDDTHDPFAEHFRTTTNTSTAVTPQTTNSARRRAIPLPPQHPPTRVRETEAQRRFLQRWSGGADAFDSSILSDEDELRASITSQDSVRRQSRFGRFARRGGPRDSLD
ncbi:hypothetical protein PISL3812_00552 [Talaromyces islandicus]|uniref:Replicase polyprotein 1a n=1 Tax=Talaromyces islandicus TaxID=28573 RepID=A0A0U1LKA2_TALIS|nr:hypothetical protein PISL3812_00552 [Talaromyces islandicus]